MPISSTARAPISGRTSSACGEGSGRTTLRIAPEPARSASRPRPDGRAGSRAGDTARGNVAQGRADLPGIALRVGAAPHLYAEAAVDAHARWRARVDVLQALAHGPAVSAGRTE